MTIEILINNIVDNIFRYQLTDANKQIEELVTQLGGKRALIKNQVAFNEVLDLTCIALENKDYLLVADLLTYELIGVL